MAKWRTTPKLDGWYEVSDAGEIRRIKAGAKGVGTAKVGKTLSVRTGKNGYRRINLSINGRRMDAVKIANLVCEAFHGAPPTAKHTPNHKNGVRGDDRAENLEWATPSEQHIHRHYVLKSYQGRPPGGYKLTEDDVRAIRILRRSAGWTYPQLAEAFIVSKQAIYWIMTRRTWKSVTP